MSEGERPDTGENGDDVQHKDFLHGWPLLHHALTHNEQDTSALNYTDPRNLQRRWLVYEALTHPPINTMRDIVTAVNPDGSEIIVDVGTADGGLLNAFARYVQENGSTVTGWYLGIEPSEQQYSGPTAALRRAVANNLIALLGKEQRKIQHGPASLHWLGERLLGMPNAASYQPIEITRGTSDDLPAILEEHLGKDGKVDISTARLTKYHWTVDARKRYRQTLQHWLAPDALNVDETSDLTEHKQKIYQLVDACADELSSPLLMDIPVEPPKRMAASYTPEDAIQEATEDFAYVSIMRRKAKIIAKTLHDSDIIAGALYSMRDQFNPQPSNELMKLAIARVLHPIREDIKKGTPFVDIASRIIILSSNNRSRVVVDGFDIIKDSDVE